LYANEPTVKFRRRWDSVRGKFKSLLKGKKKSGSAHKAYGRDRALKIDERIQGQVKVHRIGDPTDVESAVQSEADANRFGHVLPPDPENHPMRGLEHQLTDAHVAAVARSGAAAAVGSVGSASAATGVPGAVPATTAHGHGKRKVGAGYSSLHEVLTNEHVAKRRRTTAAESAAEFAKLPDLQAAITNSLAEVKNILSASQKEEKSVNEQLNQQSAAITSLAVTMVQVAASMKQSTDGFTQALQTLTQQRKAP